MVVRCWCHGRTCGNCSELEESVYRKSTGESFSKTSIFTLGIREMSLRETAENVVREGRKGYEKRCVSKIVFFLASLHQHNEHYYNDRRDTSIIV